MSSSLDSPVLVVAHDAGGAELVAAWASRYMPQPYWCVAEGAAKRVFAKAPSSSLRMLDRHEALDRLAEFRAVLTGSSWRSDLERVFIGRAMSRGLRTITYLDHWTDYRKRFVSDGRLLLPGEIWVADEHAEVIARSTFPGQDVRNVGNAYIEEVASQIGEASLPAHSRVGKKNVLFVSEPLGAAAEHKYGDKSYFGYTEYEALDEFLRYANENWAQQVGSIRIRRHPAESPGKFSAFVDAQAPIPIVECGEASLVDDCAWADWIVGCQSMAMVVGLMAGRQVFSAIPRSGRPSAIPHPGIVPLFQSQPEQRQDVDGTTP